MSVKLYEIAKASGVSISTVSRVLNNDQRKPASAGTARRVMQMAHELGYFDHNYNDTAQKMPLRSLTCLLASASDNFSDYFFAQILAGIREQAAHLGYTVSHTLSAGGMSIDAICSQIKSDATDGVILLGRVNQEMMEQIKSLTDNIVYTGLNRVDSNIDEVICDAYGAIAKSVDHLVSLGFQRIGFIGTIPETHSTVLNEHRFDAFSNTLAKHGIPLQRELCRNITLGSEQAYQAMCEMLADGILPDAICCANDNVAIGVIGALNDHQYRVPEDVSVIGLDDIETAKFMRPRLTTFNMRNHELGRFSVKILHDRIQGQHTTPVLMLLPSELILRDSCAPRKASHAHTASESAPGTAVSQDN